MAMQDVYDFFYDVNKLLLGKGLERLDDMIRPAIMSGLLSDMLTASLARHSRTPSSKKRLLQWSSGSTREGRVYPKNAAKARHREDVEIKNAPKKVVPSTPMAHREQWMCVFVYDVDNGNGTRHCATAHDVRRNLSHARNAGGLPSQ